MTISGLSAGLVTPECAATGVDAPRVPRALTSRRYTKAQKEQAVRLVRQIREETGERHGAVQRVARQLGYGVETVRKWVNQADVDAGERSGSHDGGERQDPPARAGGARVATGQ